MQEQLHSKICENWTQVAEWFSQKSQGLVFPFYCSFDLRDSRIKIAPVDANIFPAGFNNICQTDKETSVDLVKNYLTDMYPQLDGLVVLLTEEHTNNAYYWENVRVLQDIIKQAGFSIRLGILNHSDEKIKVQTSSGHELDVYSVSKKDENLYVGDEEIELLISNNDFSVSYSEVLANTQTPFNPPYSLGWFQRRKHVFFREYNQLAQEFSELIGIDPFQIQLKTESFDAFDLSDPEGIKLLAERADAFLLHLKQQYEERGIKEAPYAFVKNDSGTYGLGVVHINSGEDILKWNYKARKKMKASKGGGGVSHVILQEGVASEVRSEGDTAEPAIYMIGSKLAGGFLRAHGKKSSFESLNSPGAVYKKLCVSDLEINYQGCSMENAYGWIAKLGTLAIAHEIKASTV